MSLGNCSRCGRVYAKIQGGRDLCQSCLREEDDNYLKVFHYLSTRPAATAPEIAQATDVDIKEIYRFVRENRLRLVTPNTGLFCESCGIPLSEGKMCEKCRQKLSEEFKTDLDKLKRSHPKGPNLTGEPPNPRYLKERRE